MSLNETNRGIILYKTSLKDMSQQSITFYMYKIWFFYQNFFIKSCNFLLKIKLKLQNLLSFFGPRDIGKLKQLKCMTKSEWPQLASDVKESNHMVFIVAKYPYFLK